MGAEFGGVEDLEVYRLARDLAQEVGRAFAQNRSAARASNPASLRLIEDLRAGVETISTLIAEEVALQKAGRRPDFGALFLKASAACRETAIRIGCARAQGLVPPLRAAAWTESCNHMAALLDALYAHRPEVAAA
jgi:hypothetical protein